ncbi:hypothetical protein [Planctobacterium marinum]|uniref:Uncharacterized protein n=1 Tax=Planctobacterium marinum TaxID=1631968 RepID=A0AA48KRI4_9ALTE|nr:hypothetical protein MACH26_31290 [Planctobacterium marinum]
MAETIEFKGPRYNIRLDNAVSLNPSKDPDKWLNQNDYIKLVYTEHNKSRQQIHNQLTSLAEKSLNQFKIDEVIGLKQQEDLVLIKSLVADTEFLRIIKLISRDTNCAVLDLSLPLSKAKQYQDNIVNMLNSMRWEASKLLRVNDEPLVQLNQPVGFKPTQKFANSLVLRTTNDNTSLPEANLVLSIITETIATEDLAEKTRSILSQSKSLQKFKIMDITELSSKWGDMVIARVSGRYDASQIEVDISHTTIKMGDFLLVAQLSTIRNTESFLKLEDVMEQVLSNLVFDATLGK